jgi:hypothetical protein
MLQLRQASKLAQDSHPPISNDVLLSHPAFTREGRPARSIPRPSVILARRR